MLVIYWLGSLGAAGLPRVLSHCCWVTVGPPVSTQRPRNLRVAQGTVTTHSGCAGALPAGIVHSQESHWGQTAKELGKGCAEPLTVGLLQLGMTALGFLSNPASSVPAWCPGDFGWGEQPHCLESLDLCRAGSFALQMSTLENYTLREIQFILYKVGYLCTVNKYITNLSCLKKVLPFWCLFPKLTPIYKKVLFFFFWLVLLDFFSCEALCTSLHLVSKSCFEKKTKPNSWAHLCSLESHCKLQQHTNMGQASSWGCLCWVPRWVLTRVFLIQPPFSWYFWGKSFHSCT